MKYDTLLGRPFELGRFDCFTMVRDFYKLNFNILMRNYARPVGWSADEIDIIEGSYEAEGFDKVLDWSLKTLQPGDLLCMAIGTQKANHMAIYVGGNTLLHHKINSLSDTEVLRDFWRKSICYVLRHKDVKTEPDARPTTTLKELLDARNRLETEA